MIASGGYVVLDLTKYKDTSLWAGNPAPVYVPGVWEKLTMAVRAGKPVLVTGAYDATVSDNTASPCAAIVQPVSVTKLSMSVYGKEFEVMSGDTIVRKE